MSVIYKPHLTQKASDLNKRGKYVFTVPADQNKIQIKKGIELLYNVRVERVNSLNIYPEAVARQSRQGRLMKGRKKKQKKVILVLRRGETIDLAGQN